MFHRVLSYGAAMDYSIAHSASSKEVDIRRIIFGDSVQKGLKREIQEFFSKRQEDSPMRIGIKRGNYSS